MLREVLGAQLRSRRIAQGRTLRQVSARACVSLGYLSEIERGVKEPSSEVLAALCRALSVSLGDVLGGAAAALGSGESSRLAGPGSAAAGATSERGGHASQADAVVPLYQQARQVRRDREAGVDDNRPQGVEQCEDRPDGEHAKVRILRPAGLADESGHHLGVAPAYRALGEAVGEHCPELRQSVLPAMDAQDAGVEPAA
ncbi:MAG: helix-turn-helix domain-containing protein [Actinomycetales bacterium]|nr:helix-turn-helix domain-containing protein [Actinomycetales bacterium]